MAKRLGRKRMDYRDPNIGKPVVGLSRMPDGRWRIIGTQTRFTEDDERVAIARFHQMMGEKLYEGLPLEEIEWLRTAAPDIVAGNAITALSRGFTLIGKRDEALLRFWRYVGEEIRTRPKWVAEQTGVEQIGYLTRLKPPEKPPTFVEVESTWKEHFKKSTEQKRRVLHAWEDFKKTAGVTEIEQITPDVAISYRDAVYSRDLTPKMQVNIFSRIRRLFTFARSREIAPQMLADVIDALKRLVPSDSAVSLDPQPIDPMDYKSLIDAADAEDRAMLLLMLNGAYYCAEVVRLKWSMVKDGCIITHRNKHGRCVRVCVLWKETLDALSMLPRKTDFIFNAYTGLPLGTKGAEKRFRVLRTAAKVSMAVTSSHLRDGAATAMAQAGVTDKFFAIAMGHRSGISDHYVKRNPNMVAPACEAIRNYYFCQQLNSCPETIRNLPQPRV